MVPPLEEAQQAELKAAVQELPAEAGIGLANWNRRVVHRFIRERFGLSRSSCLNYLHRLGFAFKRPKKRLLKADEAKREAFVVEYAALREEWSALAERYSWLMRPASGRTRNCGASGRSKASQRWWIRSARGAVRRPAITLRCAWRRVSWNRWNWMGTVTAKAPWLS